MSTNGEKAPDMWMLVITRACDIETWPPAVAWDLQSIEHYTDPERLFEDARWYCTEWKHPAEFTAAALVALCELGPVEVEPGITVHKVVPRTVSRKAETEAEMARAAAEAQRLTDYMREHPHVDTRKFDDDLEV